MLKYPDLQPRTCRFGSYRRRDFQNYSTGQGPIIVFLFSLPIRNDLNVWPQLKQGDRYQKSQNLPKRNFYYRLWFARVQP